MLSEIEFGSYYTYSPRGNSESAKQSQNIMRMLKSGGSIGNPPRFIYDVISDEIYKEIKKLPFEKYFNSSVTLVPIPKSSLMQPNEFWGPAKLAESLQNKGFGVMKPYLKRIKPLKKSAYSNPSNRSKALDHYNSIQCQSNLNGPKNIVLIDDIVTRGATFLGCASRLKDVFPDIPIKTFAAIRTISRISEFKKIKDPCTGIIKLVGKEAHRSP